MTEGEIRERVCALVSEVLELEPGELSEDADLDLELGADSVSRLEMVAALERTFRIRYPVTAVSSMRNVNDVVRVTREYVER